MGLDPIWIVWGIGCAVPGMLTVLFALRGLLREKTRPTVMGRIRSGSARSHYTSKIPSGITKPFLAVKANLEYEYIVDSVTYSEHAKKSSLEPVEDRSLKEREWEKRYESGPYANGTRLLVRYNPRDPARSQIVSGVIDSGPLLIIGLFFLLVGIAIIWGVTF